MHLGQMPPDAIFSVNAYGEVDGECEGEVAVFSASAGIAEVAKR